MSTISLDKKEFTGLNALNRIVQQLDVGAWRIDFDKDDKPRFLLSCRNHTPGRFFNRKIEDVEAAKIIQRRLNDAGIKVERPDVGVVLIVAPAEAAKITYGKQAYAWERLSLEFGESVGEKRLERLNRLFAGLRLNPEDSQVVLRYNPASKEVFATAKTGSEVSPEQVVEVLNTKLNMHASQSKVYDVGVDIREKDLLKLTASDAWYGKYELARLLPPPISDNASLYADLYP